MPLIRDALLNKEDATTPISVPGGDSVICQEVTSLASCTLDELTQRLQTYSWAQVFEVVDRLNRQGTLKLTRTGPFGYALSVGQLLPDSECCKAEVARRSFSRTELRELNSPLYSGGVCMT